MGPIILILGAVVALAVGGALIAGLVMIARSASSRTRMAGPERARLRGLVEAESRLREAVSGLPPELRPAGQEALAQAAEVMAQAERAMKRRAALRGIGDSARRLGIEIQRQKEAGASLDLIDDMMTRQARMLSAARQIDELDAEVGAAAQGLDELAARFLAAGARSDLGFEEDSLARMTDRLNSVHQSLDEAEEFLQQRS
jgi:hypothetical protein